MAPLKVKEEQLDFEAVQNGLAPCSITEINTATFWKNSISTAYTCDLTVLGTSHGLSPWVRTGM